MTDVLRTDGIVFDYEPYPIGVVRPAFDAADYRALVESFPPIDLFEFKPDKGGKYSLSQVNHAFAYRRFLRRSAPWHRFHQFIKSRRYILDTLDMLKRNGLDLGLPPPGFPRRQKLRLRALWRGNPVPHFPRLKARFEFSAMPVSGGNILPHTDHPKKLVTMVIPVLREGEWDPAWGGGTSVVMPKDRRKTFNRVNDYLEFEDVEEVRTYPFEPNQCLVFVKTHNSWHAVWPMTGNDPTILRRTLTINIESS